MEPGQLVLFPQLFAACIALLPINLVQLSVLVMELLSKVRVWTAQGVGVLGSRVWVHCPQKLLASCA